MAELLHVGALGASAVGACCVALDGPRPRIREMILMVVMLLAMVDVVSGAGLVPVVWWSALTIACALVLAVRRRNGAEPRAVTRMRTHAAVGAVLMAAAMLMMPTAHAGGAHTSHHGPSAAFVVAGLVAATAVFTGSALLALRSAHRLDRVQYVAMSGSLVALCAALVL